MEFPNELRYTKEHEWVKVEGGTATIGITDHAQDALGDVVYLGDLPEVGERVDKDDVIGVVESVKATSDIFSPLTGTIAAINEELDGAPELVNESPYDKGWIIRIDVAEEGELDDLLDVEAYRALVAEEA